MQENTEKNKKKQSKKRFYAACAAMQGLISSGARYNTDKELIEDAYGYADELLKQENQ